MPLALRAATTEVVSALERSLPTDAILTLKSPITVLIQLEPVTTKLDARTLACPRETTWRAVE